VLNLLQPEAERIAPAEHRPTDDRAPDYDKYLYSNRTCEIGMNLTTGKTTNRWSSYLKT
jgi:hypothetical protein